MEAAPPCILSSRRRVAFPLLPHQYLTFPVLLTYAIVFTDMRWNLNEVLICISLMIKAVKYFFPVSEYLRG